MNIAQLAEMLQQYRQMDTDAVPDGWYTADQMAQQMNVSLTRAKVTLRATVSITA